MFVVIHIRRRPEFLRLSRWLREEHFRYWRVRRTVLLRNHILLFEHQDQDHLHRTRTEGWRSKADYEAFYDDPCARVIDSVIRQQESMDGVVHETITQEISG